MASSTKITVKELAADIGIEPKDLRVWLRSEGKGAGGKGKRYEWTPKQASDLKEKYEASQADEG